MNEVDALSELSDSALVLNGAVMGAIVLKLEDIDNEADFRKLLIQSFNSLVLALDHDKLPISGGLYVNLIAIALDNKLDIVQMIADATNMKNLFQEEFERRHDASPQTD